MVIKYRAVKFPRIEYRTGERTFILPHGYDVSSLSEKYKDWMNAVESKIETAMKNSERLVIKEIPLEKLRQLIADEVDIHSMTLGVRVNFVRFRKMSSKWASCSKYGNLTFNTEIALLPTKLIKYIVYHEVVHLIERTHNNRFWEIIKLVYPEHQKLEKDLFSYWFQIHKREVSFGVAE